MSDDQNTAPIEQHEESAMDGQEVRDDLPVEAQEETPRPKDPDEWRLWPPSAKVQIVLIAAGFGLFNFILLAIWALVMMDRFG